MLQRRAVGLYCCVLFLFAVCIFRLHYIEASDYLAVAAQGQGRFTLSIAQTRGGIFDREKRLLVNNQSAVVASVLPTPQAMAELYRVLPEDERAVVLERMRSGLPFATQLPTLDVYAVGLDVFEIPVRYGGAQIAPHIVGYLSDEGRRGVAGIERAFDDVLRDKGASFTARFQMDAAGRAMHGGGVVIERENVAGSGGVVLTLCANIQLVAQRALAGGGFPGAAVVMDVHSGDILAMASLPAFDPGDIAASLHSGYAPFINRAASGYPIGSVFKAVIAAAALESGFSVNRVFDCRGYIDIGGQVFRCNNNAIHGPIAMSRAMQVSCNTYFIDLGMRLDPDFLLAFSRHLGMDTAAPLAPGMYPARGNLPTRAEMQIPAEQANFSFGQGRSLATPLQIAQIMSVFASYGSAAPPRLVQGLTDDGVNLTQPAPRFASRNILSPQTAGAVQRILTDVIDYGSGWPALPVYGGAGGKTSSAQTGSFVLLDGQETEIVHAWFAGFYPAREPRYSIVVFVEGGESGERIAAPIFKQIADGIYALGR